MKERIAELLFDYNTEDYENTHIAELQALELLYERAA